MTARPSVNFTPLIKPRHRPFGQRTGAVFNAPHSERFIVGGGHQRVVRQVSQGGKTVEQQLFDATAAAKIWTSSVYRYFHGATRDRLFRQLDMLHDSEEWQQSDTPVVLESYKSLVRALLFCRVDTCPSLALSPNGTVFAFWKDGDARLEIEFLPNNRTRWLAVHTVGGEPERVAGDAFVERLPAILSPFQPRRWFGGR